MFFKKKKVEVKQEDTKQNEKWVALVMAVMNDGSNVELKTKEYNSPYEAKNRLYYDLVNKDVRIFINPDDSLYLLDQIKSLGKIITLQIK